MMDNFKSGYAKALLDIQNFFELNGYSWDRKSLKTLISIFISCRKELSETGEIKGLIWTKKSGFVLKK